ncbi:MAG: RagB/SusD family nutrient uptake outer membrane protein [Bacteroidales bacterium]|nr:RagB/SusD family nutrient uptake outer membrane protein [Bacteroidales bacterium]MDD2426165.1 RagB/SusD family nutrient uptake outer membrane protein [Bacteroidales bacterium]MDD3988691.1 RagB/SusD family nutrient uptake outer membrane protein [Bacteroidales bacterium]
MKIKILLVLVVIITAGSITSCSDWLDVKPKSQVKDDELFSSEPGFKEALSGVYSLLVSESLYTKELRFGMAGVLAREWSYYTTVSNGYAGEEDYDYTVSATENRIEAIWEGLYNAISNANVILEVIDGRKSVFSGDNYNIIKGEALALRAFCHFELLRYFGVSWTVNPNQPAIPYVKHYAPLQSPQLTVSQVIDKVLEDLEEAVVLLKSDPIFTGKVITELDDNGYLMNRQRHLNYYAVKGLQARIYLYKKDYPNANLCAREVINSGLFTWVPQSDMIAMNDPAGVTEQLWAIDVQALSTLATNYFSSSAGSTVFPIYSERLDLYYGDERQDDYRYMYMFENGTGANSNSRYLRKLYTPNLEDSYYQNKMTMLKISEMYYIVAESRYYTSGDYMEPVNEVRSARGLQPASEPADFIRFLTTEFRKDFLGEGQLFLFYKRHNMESIYDSEADLTGLKAYTFPLPKSETQAAERDDNR